MSDVVLSVRVQIPGPFRPLTGQKSSIVVEQHRTVGAVLKALETRFPRVVPHLRDDDGTLRSMINVYVGDEDIRFLEGEATRLKADCEIAIVPSIAGGGS